MDNSIGKQMLPFKVQQLLNTIIEKKGLGVEDAIHYLYSSDLYKSLSADSSYLWQLSTHNLYDLLKKEKQSKKRKQDHPAPVLLFLAFCLENYKDFKKLSPEDTLLLFSKYQVSDYLFEVFDTLHTQSREYIMREIDCYIKNRKKEQ